MRIKPIFLSAFLIVTAGCINNVDTTNKEYVSMKDELFKVEVLPGSFATDNCGMNPSDISTEHYVCVAFPFSSKQQEGKNWDAEYLRALDKNGWTWAGGEGNAYYLEKPRSGDCSYFLAMIGWVQGNDAEVENYFDTGNLGTIENQTYIFVLSDDLRCGDERRAKE